jgi:hypothetical protein
MMNDQNVSIGAIANLTRGRAKQVIPAAVSMTADDDE